MVKYLEISTVKHVLWVLKFISWNRPTEFQNLSLFKRRYEQNLSCENEYLHGFVLRACLQGVGDPGLVGLVSFVFTLWGTQNKRNLPH